MKHFKRYGSLLCVLAGLGCIQPSAHGTWQSYVDNTLKPEGKISIELILVAAVFIIMIVALVSIVRQGKSGRINVGWAALSLLFSALAVFCSILGLSAGTVYTKVSGDPADTVKAFFDAVIAQDYETAYSHLDNYSTLGLENPPEGENARLAYDALQKSYSYSVSGKAEIDRLEATVPVRLRYLDLPSFEKSVASRTNDNLAEFVKNNPISMVYDENDQYLPSVTEKAYSDALAFVLNKADTYYSTTELILKLEYKDGQWYILSDELLHKALAGNTIY